MRMLDKVILASSLFFCGTAFALGVDVGPVHVHSTGATQSLKIVIDTIVKDDDTKAVVRIHAHRKGDSDDKFQIKVSMADLDDESKTLIKEKLKADLTFKIQMEKLDENWKLTSIRKNEDD
jgi:hypothetical protein